MTHENKITDLLFKYSSEGKTTMMEDHITLVLHSLWILRNTASHLTFKQSTRLKQNRIFTRQVTASTKILLLRISKNMEYYNWRRLEKLLPI